jgi:hypothetical protein
MGSTYFTPPPLKKIWRPRMIQLFLKTLSRINFLQNHCFEIDQDVAPNC